MNSTARYAFSHGSDEPAVFSQRGQTKTSWMDIFSFSRMSTDISLSPVQRSCVGIDTMDEYHVQLNVVGE